MDSKASLGYPYGTWHWITYRGLLAAAKRVALSLVTLGVAPGARVGISAPNTAASVEVLIGLFWGGFVAVPFADNLGDVATRHIIAEAELSAIFVSPEGHKRFASLAPGIQIVPCVGSQTVFRAWLNNQPAPPPLYEPEAARRRGGDDAAVVIYTSGSTGRPKGAVISAAALMFECSQDQGG